MFPKLLRTEAVVQRCSLEKVFLEISQDSQDNTCARVSFFAKVAGLRPATLLKKRPWHSCFPVNFAKFLRTPFYRQGIIQKKYGRIGFWRNRKGLQLGVQGDALVKVWVRNP